MQSDLIVLGDLVADLIIPIERLPLFPLQNVAPELPVVPSIKSILFPPNGVRIAQLVHFARLRRQAQQEVGPTMEELAFGNTGGVALLSRRGAAEAERAAHCLKRAALRLEVIELWIEKIAAEAERMFSF